MRTSRTIVTVFLLMSVLVACRRSALEPSTSLPEGYEAAREFQVQAQDVSLHVRMAGNRDSGCVLIAINGGPGLTSNYMWDLAAGWARLRCTHL